MQENDLLASLRTVFARSDPSVLTGSGPDDCAHLRPDKGQIAVSTDAFAEGTHFTDDHSPEDIARKALGASLSDLAASGCSGRWALVTLCLRPGLPEDWTSRFAAAMAGMANDYGTTIVGGDTIAAGHGIVVTVTVIGEPFGERPVLRSGAKPGDVLVVTGCLGGSIHGRHLRPEPRLWEMQAIVAALALCDTRPSAAMDISDGLAMDLNRLCTESGCGAVIRASDIPIADDARRSAEASGRTPLHHALTDGEDFELLLALPPDGWDDLDSMGWPTHYAPLTAIGGITADTPVLLEMGDGATVPLRPEGYQHQW